MAVVLIGKTCRQCNRGIPPAAASQLGDELQGHLCEDCRVADALAQNALVAQLNNGQADDIGQHCADCCKSLDEIERLTGKRSLFIHMKDGMKVLLCKYCSDAYELVATDSRTARGRFRWLTKDEFKAKIFSEPVPKLLRYLHNLGR